ncbi:hypothetical protein VTO42DRAFT_6809 [Malbranchea cinnamomea]
MASGLIFDPLKLLRLTPLLTSTTSLTYAGNEHLYLSNFLAPQHKEKSDAILPSYFRRLFNVGVWIVIGVNAVTIGSALVNVATLSPSPSSGGMLSRIFPGKMPSARWFYGAGALFQVLHFAYVPLVAYPVRDIVEGRSNESTREMKKWLDVHRIRVLTTDLPGWLSFLAAVLATISV